MNVLNFTNIARTVLAVFGEYELDGGFERASIRLPFPSGTIFGTNAIQSRWEEFATALTDKRDSDAVEYGPEYVERILTQSGFNGISVAPLSHPLVFGRGLALADIVERLVQIGPIAQMVRDAPGDLQQPVRDKVIAAVSAYYTEASGMTLEGQFWHVTATT